MDVTNTCFLISQCWKLAEEHLQTEIREDYPGANEEFITKMFHGQFSKVLKSASKDELIGKAFLKDLKRSFPSVNIYDLAKLSQGLTADFILHRRSTEAITGGDIGFAFTRPLIEDRGNLLKIRDYRRGLLCQAKLKKPNGKWNGFSGSQKRVLGDRLQYLGLLLYEYEDIDRRNLNHFKWQLCHESSGLPNVIHWLKTGIFPSIVDSKRVIYGIGNGIIGTDDEKILNEIISPKSNTWLEVLIDWPDDKKPGSEIEINIVENAELDENPRVYVHVHN